MPETEEIELRTDTVEQLADHLDTSQDFWLDESRREAIAERLRRQISRPDAVAFCGLPGAGKSYTAEKLADVYDTSVVSMGDAIRANCPVKEPDSEALGNFAAQVRADDARTIPGWVTKIAEKKGDDLVIIDGVRSRTDYEVLNDYFDDFYLIEVKAPFYKRLGRLQDRGREGEASFSAVDLAERDEREHNDLGFMQLKQDDLVDLEITNGTGADKLAISLSEIVENNLPFEIENGKPLGLDEDLEKFRKRKKAQPGGGPIEEDHVSH